MPLTVASIRNMSAEEITRTAQHLLDMGDYGPIVKEVFTQFVAVGATDIKEELEECTTENRRLRQRINDIRGLTEDE